MLKTLSTSTERVAGAGAGCYLDTGCGHMLLVTGLHCTVGQSPKGMMVFIYIGHYQGCRVLK